MDGRGMRSRIGIIDDHPTVVLGVAGILNAEPDLRVVATGGSVAELLEDGERLDVVLLDLVLADASTPTRNLEALAKVGARVVAFTSGDRPELIREAGRAGALGMIRKSELPSAIVTAVRAAVAGEVVASPEWAAALDSDPGLGAVRLSAREAEVLALYACGETAERVGAQLYISRETVLDHIRRIRAKYAAADRSARTKVDLYRRAVEDGFVSQPQ